MTELSVAPSGCEFKDWPSYCRVVSAKMMSAIRGPGQRCLSTMST
jgi:hypothetical protein